MKYQNGCQFGYLYLVRWARIEYKFGMKWCFWYSGQYIFRAFWSGVWFDQKTYPNHW